MNPPSPASPIKPPGPVTLAYLKRAAMAYLERYGASEQQLRSVLMRRINRRCRLRGEEPQEFYPLVEEVVEAARRLLLVDDVRYTQGKVATMRRKGTSGRMIAAKLAAKGVPRLIVQEALEAHESTDQEAALAFAKRKKLGPWRPAGKEAVPHKEMAAMGRAGFSFELARQVLNHDPIDD
jgi:regulatory protein